MFWKKNRGPNEKYLGLRALILTQPYEEFGFSPEAADPIFVLAMESCYGGVPTTLLAVSDGTVSLYFGNGGGIIGAGQHEPVRKAARRFLTTAGAHLSPFEQAVDFPVVAPGEVAFIARTPGGDLRAVAPMGEIVARKHFLTPLFAAGQDVITQIRLHSNMR